MRSPARSRLVRSFPLLLGLWFTLAVPCAAAAPPLAAGPVERIVFRLLSPSDVSMAASVAARALNGPNPAVAFGATAAPMPLVPTRTADGVFVLDVPRGAQAAVLERLGADSRVAYAQPDHVYETHAVPVSPFWNTSGSWGQPYADLWNLKKLDLERAWDVTQGQGVVVAVLDSGVDVLHNDLYERIWNNPLEGSGGDGVDGDSNGFLDDTSGWNTVQNNGDVQDRFGHGTHMAGIIAARDVGYGPPGVAHNARIMAVKVADDAGRSSSSRLAAGIHYATANGADIIVSASGCAARCPQDPVVEHAIRRATAAGILVIVSAGNRGEDVAFTSPQNMVDPKPLVVAATNHLDARATFSNFGDLVDLSAPGGGTNTPPPSVEPQANVLSLRSTYCSPIVCPLGLVVVSPLGHAQYVRRAGTSMAAAHVAGVAALVLATQPDMPLETLRARLLGNARDFGPAGHDPMFGTGRLTGYPSLQDTTPFLLARIFAPAAGQRISAVQRIFGTAAARSFLRYELSVGAGAAPTTWVTTGLTSLGEATTQGELGSWNTEDVTDGTWTIRLVVRETTGRTREVRRTVIVDNSRVKRELAVDIASESSGAGSVHVSASRTFCDGAVGETQSCSYLVDRGPTVTLTAIADGLSSFTGWSGACTGTGPCTVAMTESRRVRATFDGPRRLTLIMRSIRFGSGNVVASPRDQACNAGETCTFLYRRGESVTVRAYPYDPPALPGGTSFSWEEGQPCERYAQECTVVLNDNVTLRGIFEEEPDPPSISLCCPGSYELGTPIELFAMVSSEAEITQRIWYRVIPKPDGSADFVIIATDTDVVTLTDLPLGDHHFSFWVVDSWSHVERADIMVTVVEPGTLPPPMRKGGE